MTVCCDSVSVAVTERRCHYCGCVHADYSYGRRLFEARSEQHLAVAAVVPLVVVVVCHGHFAHVRLEVVEVVYYAWQAAEKLLEFGFEAGLYFL